MSRRRGRLSDAGFDKIVVYMRQVVPAGVVIDGRGKSSYIYALSHPSAEPVLINGENVKIVLTDMVTVIAGVLHNRRFALAGSSDGGRKVFVDAMFKRSPCLTHVSTRAGSAIYAGA